MEERFWHGINKKTHPIGFGCWQIAGVHSENGKPNGWGKVLEKDALDILVRAMEMGFNFFDTAQGYNSGRSECLLGKAQKIVGSENVICTKIALTDEEVVKNKIGAAFLQRLELSLANLQTSHIDILLLHNPPDQMDWSNFDSQLLDSLVSKGTIGTYGISSRSISGAKNAIASNFGTTIEWVFNIFEQRPVDELFPLMSEKNLNFIARSPLSRGLISPKYLKEEPLFASDDFRSTLPADWIKWLVHELRKLHQKGVPENEIIQNAISYCIQFDAVKSSVVGIKSKKQLDELIQIKASISTARKYDFDLLSDAPIFFPKWA